MNSDPVYQKLREISWRRRLTDAEQSELRAWLAVHPEAQAEAEAEDLLNAALAKLPDAPVPSNFTAGVLRAIEREASTSGRSAASSPNQWWQRLLPRFAMATVLLVGLTLAYRQNVATQRQELVTVAREVVAVDPTVLADFDVIASLSPTAAAVDENLLALSDDLMAISK